MKRIGREIYIPDYFNYYMDDVICVITEDCTNMYHYDDTTDFSHHNVSYESDADEGYHEMISMYLQGKSPELKHYEMEDVVSKYSLDVSKFGEHEYRKKVLGILPEEWRFVQLFVERPSYVGNNQIDVPDIYEGRINEEFYDKTWVLYNSNIFYLALPCVQCNLNRYQLYFFTLKWDVIIDNELYMPIAQDNRPLWGIEYMFTCSHWQDLFSNMDIYFKNVSTFCKSADYRFKTEGFFCNKVISGKHSLENAVKYLKSVDFPLTDIDYRDFTSCIFEEGYLFESYICNNVPLDSTYCFRGSYMWDGFLLPQEFSTKDFTDMFICTRLPKRLTESEITNESDFEEIISSLKRLNVSTKEEIMSALKLLIQQGKSIENSKSILLSWGADVSVVNGITFSMEDAFRDKCNSTIDKLLVVTGEKSRYTIGEVKDILVSRGYPVDLVDNCIVEYLKDQYIV